MSSIVPLERAMVVSCRLSIMTIALSQTIRPQFAIECLQGTVQRGSLLVNFMVFPLEQIRDIWFFRERTPRLTEGEIISADFQPM